VQSSFLGLIDDAGLKIVLVDFPCPERNGSFAATVTVGEVYRWMQDAFDKGADPSLFDGLSFKPWR
jgi:hypothetical protein